MTDATGEVTYSARYTPWGDTLDASGTGNLTFGYFGGLMDAATGLLYVGDGQYYDPSTGRFLTRNAKPNQTNPYLPFDPTGALFVPLALISLLYGKNKKKSKWAVYIIVSLLCITASIGVTACGNGQQPPAGSTIEATVTPVSSNTALASTEVNGTQMPTALVTVPPNTSVEQVLDQLCNPVPTAGEPIRPANLDPSLEYVWETYINLWRKQDGWWWNATNGTKRFLPVDFLGWLHHFEFSSPRPEDLDDLTLLDAAVGSFCFWTTRTGSDWQQERACNPNPTDLDIFWYAHNRGLLKYGAKNYSVTGTNPNYYTVKKVIA